MMTYVEELGKKAKEASFVLSAADTSKRNLALEYIASELDSRAGYIIDENNKDLKAADESGMNSSLRDRLKLNPERIKAMASGVREVAALPEPTGRLLATVQRPNGLRIDKISVPMGVIGIIYEARPNVTADAAALCLKAGSSVILRGGREAVNSSRAIASIMRSAVKKAGLPENAICFVDDTSRDSAKEMMGLKKYIDVLIPRGGAGLINSVVENATVPVIETGIGICHIYVEATADLEMAANIIFNAKCSRPSVCNAAECLIVDESITDTFLPAAKKKLDTMNVELRCDERSLAALNGAATPAADKDFDTEFLDYILAVKTVTGIDEAISFINRHGSKHSEAIVTGDTEKAERFLREVDAAAVYVNASTRFTDGGEFGLGAELGISTQKLHARGPMGLEELTTVKYVIHGSGQVR